MPLKSFFYLLILCLSIPLIKPPHISAAERQPQFLDIYPMTADPRTDRFVEYFSSSTLENGRIWVDKTVNNETITFYDIHGEELQTIMSRPDDFLVTLSALSQSYSIETVTEPTDAVFVLDVSASMDVYRLGGDSRAAVMVRALNSAIHSLMQANPANRVAVVAYGGSTGSMRTNISKVYTPLILGHYAISGDQYFSITGNNIRVSAEINPLFTPDRSVPVAGSTPTQRGIYEGAKILMNNADTKYEYVTEKGKHVTLTRRPALILLTDGEPTMAWSDYSFANAPTDNGYDCGDGNPASLDMGMSLLTVATASYYKERVGIHYYPEGRDETRFYTIGAGVSSGYAAAVMDPQNHARYVSYGFNGVTYNMKSLLEQWAGGQKIAFPVQNKNNAARRLITIDPPPSYAAGFTYTDGYFPAGDEEALDEAFQNIASQIISSGYYTTQSDLVNPNFSGYLVLSDAIGEHMRFREHKGFWLDGNMYYGEHLAQELVKGSESAEWERYLDVFGKRLGVSETIIEDIIHTSAAGGLLYHNSDSDYRCGLRWYADIDTEYVGLYYNKNGGVNPPPEDAKCCVELYPLDGIAYDKVSSAYTNLLYTDMSVTTTLTAGVFGLKSAPDVGIPLKEGQQLVRWYVPASLIPLRTVSEVYDDDSGISAGLEIDEALPIRANYTVGIEEGFTLENLSDYYKEQHSNGSGGYYLYSNDWRPDNPASYDAAIAFFRPNRLNPYYYFTSDTPLYTFSEGEYAPAASYSADENYYVLREYFDEKEPGYLVNEYALADQTVTSFSVTDEGVPYVPAGQRKKSSAVIVMKANNNTQTMDYTLDARFNSENQMYFLGNNGAMEIKHFTQAAARKAWRGSELPSVWIQLYADGVPVLKPVELSAANGWKYLWTGLLRYSTDINDDGSVSPITYTVVEGSYANEIFTPYNELNTPLDYSVSYEQPVWDPDEGLWSDAEITNRHTDFVSLSENLAFELDSPSADSESPAPAEIPEQEPESPAPESKPPSESPALESEPPSESPALESEPAPESPAPESEPPSESPALESEPASESPALESEPASESPALESEPAPESPALESEPAPESPALESEPAPESPALESEPAPESPALESEPAPESPALESEPAPESPALESEPASESPALESEPPFGSPVLESAASSESPAAGLARPSEGAGSESDRVSGDSEPKSDSRSENTIPESDLSAVDLDSETAIPMGPVNPETAPLQDTEVNPVSAPEAIAPIGSITSGEHTPYYTESLSSAKNNPETAGRPLFSHWLPLIITALAALYLCGGIFSKIRQTLN